MKRVAETGHSRIVWVIWGALCLFLGTIVAFSQEETPPPEPPPAEFTIPPEEANRQNPVKITASSIAQGGRLFRSQCAMCHGQNGDGKGDLADVMQLQLRNYRDPAALEKITDGELFYILSKGKDKMPGQDDRMSADQRWHLINFIRSLARKQPPPKPKEDKPE